MRTALVAALVASLAGAVTADAGTLHGVVFSDLDGDGKQGPNEPGVGSAVVAYDVTAFVVTDGSGQFDLPVPGGATGNAWVRVPDGFAPGPVWQNVTAATQLALPLHPVAPRSGPLTFVMASDTHMTSAQPFANDLAAAAAQATALAPPPAFFAISGDITSGGADDEFALVSSQLAPLGVPYAPIPGNHDCYYGCANYVAHYAPDNYSFDAQGVHFVVWNMALSDEQIAAYLTADLSRVAPSLTRVAISHAPPDPATVSVLQQLGVAYVITGHTHTNRVIDHGGGLVELNGEPFLMGGLDFTPAGYRVLTIDAGKLTAYHRTTMDAPFLQLMSPGNGQCVAPDGDVAFVAAEIDAGANTVTAAIDGGAPLAGSASGGWTYTVPLPALATGMHTLVATATSASGATTSQTTTFAVCTRDPAPLPAHDWPQLGGDAAHHNDAGSAALAPPLVPRWTQAAFGHVLQAAPVIANGLVIAVGTDLGDDTTGGVVAIDLATGAVAWRTPARARGGAAVIGSVVIVAQLDGSVLGLDLDTGAVLWTTQLGSGERAEATFIEGAPTIDDGAALIGNEHAFAALDPATGTPAWTVDPIAKPFDFATLDSIAVGGGLVIGSFARTGGVTAWDRDSGAIVWQTTSEQTTGVNGSPVVDEAAGAVYIVDSADDVTAYDLGTGSGASGAADLWKTQLDAPWTGDWSYAISGTPALSNGVLVVPTLAGDLVAVDAASGEQMWRVSGSPSPIRTTHYRGSGMAGFEGSPLIAGNVVFAADTSGTLRAFDLHTSAELWRTELGAPVLASLAAADGWLVAATYDGTVHAWSLPYGSPVTDPLEPQSAGCCDAGGDPRGSLALGALVVGSGLARRRRRRCP